MGFCESAGCDHLIPLSADQAFQAYEAVRHRLPTIGSANSEVKTAETLDDLIDLFDVFLLDAFGVLNIGETAIPGVRERIEGLREANKRVLVVSNAASVPRTDLQKKYKRLGYEFPLEDLITSRATMAAFMEPRDERLWGVMNGSGAGLDEFPPLRMMPLGDDPETYRAVDGFLLIGSAGWTETRQALLENALIERPRRVLVANPDIVAPRETGFSAEPGFFAHQLADRCGIVPEFFGKPFSNIFELASMRIGPYREERTLMVGDSLHTDILGARSFGLASALVTDYGFFAGQSAIGAVQKAEIYPDFLIVRP